MSWRLTWNVVNPSSMCVGNNPLTLSTIPDLYWHDLYSSIQICFLCFLLWWILDGQECVIRICCCHNSIVPCRDAFLDSHGIVFGKNSNYGQALRDSEPPNWLHIVLSLSIDFLPVRTNYHDIYVYPTKYVYIVISFCLVMQCTIDIWPF